MISIFYTTDLETPGLKLHAAPGFPEFVFRECRAAGAGWVGAGCCCCGRYHGMSHIAASHLPSHGEPRFVDVVQSEQRASQTHIATSREVVFFPYFLSLVVLYVYLVSRVPQGARKSGVISSSLHACSFGRRLSILHVFLTCALSLLHSPTSPMTSHSCS